MRTRFRGSWSVADGGKSSASFSPRRSLHVQLIINGGVAKRIQASKREAEPGKSGQLPAHRADE